MKAAVQVELPEIRRKDIILDVSCRDCVFYTRVAAYAKPCQELAVPATAIPCKRFVVDPRPIDTGPDLLRIMKILSRTRKKNLVAAMLVGAAKVSRKGYTIGQTVVFKVLSPDYINNYATGYVIGVNGDHVVLSGKADFTAYLSQESILTLEEWEEKRDTLIATKRINDPQGLQRIFTKSGEKLRAYVPALLAKRGKFKKKKSKTVVTKLGASTIISG